MSTVEKIKSWFLAVYAVWRREFTIVFRDAGVLVFFFVLPLLYPVVYTLIYNPELARDIPVAVVDNCRSAGSRELVRMADATETMKVIGYAANLDEARRWQNGKACYGILVIPDDYSRRIGRGEQAVVPFYVEMSLLLRYRAFISALTDLSLATGASVRQADGDAAAMPVGNVSVFLGDSTQGFASFIIPGILVLIIQQSLLLGITMLGGGAAERRRVNRGYDPVAVDAHPVTTVTGKSLCYFTLYMPLTVYVLYLVPRMFALPHPAGMTDVVLFILPVVLASIFMGLTLQMFVRERESSMLMFVYTSVIFLFLSGLTWPRYAMSGLWRAIGGVVPATWGIEGFVGISSNGASLSQVSGAFVKSWVLAAVYFVTATFAAFMTTRRSSASTRK